MIEFTINRNKNGKKSRWAKKYPRKRILKRGSEKAAGWYFHSWYHDNFHYFSVDITKFLMSNLGKPVNKVFSEFLRRCRKCTGKYNLRDKFYSVFKNKEDIDYKGGFYLTNGIINYRKGERKPKKSVLPMFNYGQYNLNNLPDKNTLLDICNKAKDTHNKQPIGEFYISGNSYDKVEKVMVYIATTSDYKESYFYMKLCNIIRVGVGVRFINGVYRKDRNINYVCYISQYTYDERNLPQYVFITKNKE